MRKQRNPTSLIVGPGYLDCKNVKELTCHNLQDSKPFKLCQRYHLLKSKSTNKLKINLYDSLLYPTPHHNVEKRNRNLFTYSTLNKSLSKSPLGKIAGHHSRNRNSFVTSTRAILKRTFNFQDSNTKISPPSKNNLAIFSP